jgi:2-polyprenyl-3-methyl-5-hydroxy-6-metoxy-1,4-benzoquinol methylase
MMTHTLPAAVDVAGPGPDALDRLLAAHWWYHQMALTHGRSTPGTFGDNLIPVARLLRHVTLRGMACLDIGTMDGKMAFLLERLGGRVLAVDGVAKGTVPALVKAFASSVRYRSGVIVETLPDVLASEGLFDFVLCSGVAYHVYSPFDLIAHVRALLRNGGMAIVETAAIPDEERLFMSLNRGDSYKEHTTLWIPTTACFRHMLRFMSLRVLGESQLHADDRRVVRHAWLVQADKPSTLATEAADPWLATLLGGLAPGSSHEYLKPQLDHARFESRPQSRITATPVPELPPMLMDEPHTYAPELALLAEGTPAWRLLNGPR